MYTAKRIIPKNILQKDKTARDIQINNEYKRLVLFMIDEMPDELFFKIFNCREIPDINQHPEFDNTNYVEIQVSI